VHLVTLLIGSPHYQTLHTALTRHLEAVREELSNTMWTVVPGVQSRMISRIFRGEEAERTNKSLFELC